MVARRFSQLWRFPTCGPTRIVGSYLLQLERPEKFGVAKGRVPGRGRLVGDMTSLFSAIVC
jgi:hypothetical protein